MANTNNDSTGPSVGGLSDSLPDDVPPPENRTASVRFDLLTELVDDETDPATLLVNEDRRYSTNLPVGYEVVERTETTPMWYRLGYVLEAIADNYYVNRNISNENDTETIREFDFYYQVFDTPQQIPLPAQVTSTPPAAVFTATSSAVAENLVRRGEVPVASRLSQSQNFFHLTCNTTFELPVQISAVDSLLINKNNSSVSNLIKNVVSLCSRTLANFRNEAEGPNLGVDLIQTASDPNTIEVVLINSVNQTLENNVISELENPTISQNELSSSIRGRLFAVNYSHNNSLVESIDVSSKIDASAWAAFRQTGFSSRLGTNLLEKIYNSFDNRGQSKLLPQYMFDISRIYYADQGFYDYIEQNNLQFISDFGGVEAVKDLISLLRQPDLLNNKEKREKANSYLGSLIYLDPKFYNTLLTQFIEQGEESGGNFMTQVLSNYLLTVDATVHGISGLSPLDPVFVDNVVEGVRGIYYISNLEESLTPSNYNTLMTMKLAKTL